MTEIAPKDALAAFTRAEVENHGEGDWDGAHALMTLHNVDGELRIGAYAMIDPAISPDAYAPFIARIAAESITKAMAKDDPASPMPPDREQFPPPCAYLLQIEAYMAKLPPDATEPERAQFDRDGRDRKIHARPDAAEIVSAVCADVHGRLYSAMKERGSDEITVTFHAPLDRQAGNGLTGRFADALLAAAYATGMACWALPGPIPMSN